MSIASSFAALIRFASPEVLMRSFLFITLAIAACTASSNMNNGGGSNEGSGNNGSGNNGSGNNGSGNNGSGNNGSGNNGSGTTTASDLVFAVVGDTRPATIDDTSNYPSAIISKIYQDVEAESPKPQLVVGTGDYQFTSPSGSQQTAQFDKYMAARSAFSGPFYPAMGNHECTGATASNCGQGATDGITANMSDFMSTMLTPLNVNEPYYVEHVAAADNSWNAKFVFVACNAWSSTQSSWLNQALSEQTTYTFVVRHESNSALSQTPCSASQSIISAHPMTLLIVGHTHEYRHESYDKEIIVGNGGAPLTSGTNYGYVVVKRNSTGTLTVTTYDYMSHAVLDAFTITPTGSGA
jgi:predicted phosphodiesterase